MEVCCPYFDPDFENLDERINGPRVAVDYDSCDKCTVIKVDSIDRQGLLLEVLQVLTDMDLIISKSYISSDAGWFMDGNKKLINYSLTVFFLSLHACVFE